MEADGSLLVARQRVNCSQVLHRARHFAAVVTPRERNPGTVLYLLVPQVRGLLEGLIVIDSKHRSSSGELKIRPPISGPKNLARVCPRMA